ncbi:hypothetical protein ACOI1C_05920 [Bacillus sp. DJP31]|uniref:hypothetical protein n=1 Tax=Bacillus sp. DJP31 TaxID=3409789 RepID=UPI003BB7F553
MTNQEWEGKISEGILEKYVYLNKIAKEAKEEMDKIKHVFHLYFDETSGPNAKGEVKVGDYFVQRQIRVSEGFDDEKTVEHLEQVNLAECIQYVKKADGQKIEAAIQLGLLNGDEINQFKISKMTQAISVKKMK